MEAHFAITIFRFMVAKTKVMSVDNDIRTYIASTDNIRNEVLISMC